MSEIFKTKNYSIFKKHHFNRNIDEGNLKKITNSMKAMNLLQFRPILVDKEMNVIDGQHRLKAAEMLDLEIFYQISENDSPENIILLNANQKAWGIADYINYYASQGNNYYINFLEFCKEANIKISEGIAFTKNKNGRDISFIKNGKFKFINQDEQIKIKKHIQQKKEIVQIAKKYVFGDKDFLDTRSFSDALITLLRTENYSQEVFLRKIVLNSHLLKKCASPLAYFEMIRNIYNWKNQNPIE